jgi:hypothetical protein
VLCVRTQITARAGCCCVRTSSGLRATVLARVLLRACVSAAACDRGVRAAAASVGAARCVRPWCARFRVYVRTHPSAVERTLVAFFSLSPFFALANHVSTQCPAQHKIPKILEND